MSRVESEELAEIFHGFGCGQAVIQGGGSGKKSDVRADFGRFAHHVESSHRGRSGGGAKNDSQHAQRGGLARAVGSEQSVDLPWLAAEAHRIHGADCAAFLVIEHFA